MTYDLKAGMDAVQRHPRLGSSALAKPAASERLPLKVAVTDIVCYRFRLPILRRISDCPYLKVRVLVGSGTPGTKVSNAPDRSDVDTRIMWTLQRRMTSTGRPVFLTFNPTLLFQLIRFRPDVLLIQGGLVPNNMVNLLYAKITGTPIVWWSLGRVYGREFRGLSKYYQKLNRWIEKRATCYAAYSSASVNHFLECGYPADRIFNLVNVVDTDLVARRIEACQDRIEGLRQDLGLEGKRVIILVGSLTKTKAVDLLVRAFAELTEFHESTRLLIVGDGPERAPAEALAAELGIADSTIFTGAVYDGVEAYFQLADLMVLPGTGGLAISEGMTHGLPVICSVGDGVEVDLIDEGVNGYRVGAQDVPGLVEKMRLILASDDKLKAMGAASRRIIDERANISNYMKEMLSAILFAHRHRRGAGK
jgi:glycosyltransferase involved in cell wall biosynthesis